MSAEEYLGTLPAGHRLQEYEFVSVLGIGGFGITYLANDTRLQMRVAIKEYLPSSFAVRGTSLTVYPKSKADEENYRWGLDRFMKEAQTLARFRHPNIVRVLRFFEENGTAYTVMEYEEGQSLAEFLRDHPEKLGEEFFLKLLLPLLDGLGVVHKAGYLHRDIKPNNLYLRQDDSPVLIDFGSARQSLGSHTQNLTSVYTPGYAPFEQYLPDGRQGPWTDIYALGAVLYRMVAGYAPFDAATRMNGDTLVPISVVGRGRYSLSFLLAIDQSLRMVESERPQNIEAWLAMFRAAPAVPQDMPLPRPATAVSSVDFPPSLAGKDFIRAGAGDSFKPSVSSSQRTAPERSTTSSRSRREPEPRESSPPWGGIVVVLILVVLAGVLWSRDRNPQSPAPPVDLETPAMKAESPPEREELTYAEEAPIPAVPLAPAEHDRVTLPAEAPAPHAESVDASVVPLTPFQGRNGYPPDRAMAVQDRSAVSGLNIDNRFRQADLENRGSLSRAQASVAFPMVARYFDRADVDRDGRLSHAEVADALLVMRRKGLHQ